LTILSKKKTKNFGLVRMFSKNELAMLSVWAVGVVVVVVAFLSGNCVLTVLLGVNFGLKMKEQALRSDNILPPPETHIALAFFSFKGYTHTVEPRSE
jgi:hypothetical protein